MSLPLLTEIWQLRNDTSVLQLLSHEDDFSTFLSLLAASYEKVIKLVEKEKREAEEFFIEKRKIILQCNDKGNTSIPRIKLIQEESREREYFDAYVCKECTKKMIGATNAAKNKMLCYECMIRSRSPGQEMYVLLGGIIANPP